MNAATTERPTMNDDLAGTPTWPVLSQNRQAGILWSERLMRQASTAAADSTRFMAGLESE